MISRNSLNYILRNQQDTIYTYKISKFKRTLFTDYNNIDKRNNQRQYNLSSTKTSCFCLYTC